MALKEEGSTRWVGAVQLQRYLEGEVIRKWNKGMRCPKVLTDVLPNYSKQFKYQVQRAVGLPTSFKALGMRETRTR